MIEAKNLVRTYKVPVRSQGFKSALKSLIRKEYKTIDAVKSIDLSIADGEIVAFLGPNGAGKTTTLKMLTGLIHPTSGEVYVEGYKPYERKREFLKSVTLLMGNRGNLNWNLPVSDSFEFNKAVYNVGGEGFETYFGELIEIMGISDLLCQPARNLSLGQRMRCEIVLSLIHKPRIIFLDEPTIGLDITAQRLIRKFIKEYNVRYNATIMITSHNMNDIENLCDRVIVINHGEIIFDDSLANLTKHISNEKIIVISTEDEGIDYEGIGKIHKYKDGRIELLVDRGNIKETVSQLVADSSIYDIDIKEIPIEDIIEKLYQRN